MVENVIGELTQSYVSSLAEKLSEIETLCSELERSSSDDPDKRADRWMSLCAKAHKLVGSAGTYGFAEISEHARALEDQILSKHFESIAPHLAREQLEAWFKTLKMYIQEAQKAHGALLALPSEVSKK